MNDTKVGTFLKVNETAESYERTKAELSKPDPDEKTIAKLLEGEKSANGRNARTA